MKISIRPFKMTDVTPDYIRWMNDPEVTRYLGAAGRPQSVDDIYKYVASLDGVDKLFFAIEAYGRHVGNAKLIIQREHGKGVISLMIGEKSLWGRGIGAEVIRQIADVAFIKLGLRKLEAGVLAPNVGSYYAFKRNGFAVDGVHSLDRHFEGWFVDAVYMSRFREDWVYENADSH